MPCRLKNRAGSKKKELHSHVARREVRCIRESLLPEPLMAPHSFWTLPFLRGFPGGAVVKNHLPIQEMQEKSAPGFLRAPYILIMNSFFLSLLKLKVK